MNCSALTSAAYKIPSTLQSVRVHPGGSASAWIGKGQIPMSALAYDENNQPIWHGIWYEWGISSSNSIGSVNPTVGNITNFTPLNTGTGDVFVVARMGNQMQASGVLMTVTQSRPGDVNGDGFVRLNDLSALLSFFGRTGGLGQGDVNGDGLINLQDLSILLSNFRK